MPGLDQLDGHAIVGAGNDESALFAHELAESLPTGHGRSS